MTEQDRKALKKLSPLTFGDGKLSKHFVALMDQYIKWAKNNGVCVILMPPNLLYFKEYNEKPFKEFFQNIKSYAAKKNIKFVGSPQKHMFNTKYYLNTLYHLNSEGVKLNTEQIIKDIGKDPFSHCPPCFKKLR